MPNQLPTNFVRAYLLKEGGKRIMCWFNPSTLSLTRASNWSAGQTTTQATPDLAYAGGAAETLQLNLLLHADDSMKGRSGAQVRAGIDTIFSLLDPSVEVPKRTQKRPPTVQFVWGQYVSFVAVAQSVAVTQELFDPDGTPLRATIAVTLKQFRPDPGQGPSPGQNPTTRATKGRRSHTIAPGDSLASIAWHHFRDPTRWKEIAEANAIDDPTRLTPGDQLLILTGTP
ncbi:hypothetical protein DSM104299_02206 [Baekduia alba]|uniref:CIS tube protein n=1 Tax=Baekduia alba TaxID=2997333 RepID=UPI0023404CBF|nr:LysM peptidoglycan-binding domain-containing protein [Baekduia alba]WCB93493.1 hypothetical protein DSM104299_02206 [Baekduia alba]